MVNVRDRSIEVFFSGKNIVLTFRQKLHLRIAVYVSNGHTKALCAEHCMDDFINEVLDNVHNEFTCICKKTRPTGFYARNNLLLSLCMSFFSYIYLKVLCTKWH